MQLLDALLKLVLRYDSLLEGSLPDTMRQCQLGCQGDIAVGDGFPTLKGSLGACRLEDHQVCPVAFNVKRSSQGGNG